MATYLELVNFYNTADYDTLRNKIKVAAVIKAKAIADLATPTPEQIAYAKEVFYNPSSQADIIINYVLASNSGATIAQIISATDTTIQNNVNDSVDDLLSL